MGFDVCAGTDCQVYYGRNRATDMTDAAVDNTAGEMIYYGGKPADTVVYCASNGGATEDAANVWSSIPYLVGKKDPYEAQTTIPNYNWTVTYTADGADVDPGAEGVQHRHCEERLCGGVHADGQRQQGDL